MPLRTASRFLAEVIQAGNRENIDHSMTPVLSRRSAAIYWRSLERCSLLNAQRTCPQHGTCSQRGNPKAGSIAEPNLSIMNLIPMSSTSPQEGQGTRAERVDSLLNASKRTAFLSHLNPQFRQRLFPIPLTGPNHSPLDPDRWKEQCRQVALAFSGRYGITYGESWVINTGPEQLGHTLKTVPANNRRCTPLSTNRDCSWIGMIAASVQGQDTRQLDIGFARN
jgi:hypothetical protein